MGNGPPPVNTWPSAGWVIATSGAPRSIVNWADALPVWPAVSVAVISTVCWLPSAKPETSASAVTASDALPVFTLLPSRRISQESKSFWASDTSAVMVSISPLKNPPLVGEVIVTRGASPWMTVTVSRTPEPASRCLASVLGRIVAV